jgi:hypothetical protein
MTPGAQANWKIACSTAAAQKVDNDIIADAGNAYWHKGAARTVAVTIGASSTTMTIPGLQAADARRPISTATGLCVKGGTFIKSVSGTTATLSQATTATGCGATTLTIEHTQARVIVDATCTAAGVITSASANFLAASDNFKSVTGGPFKDGSRITAVTATTATVKLASGVSGNSAVCTAPDTLTIGATTYASATATAPIWNTDPQSVDLVNSTANGSAFTCVAAGHALVESAGATADGQAFNANYVGLKVVVKGTTTVATSVTAATATTLTLAGTCPAGVTATAGEAAIGQPGANAPKPGSAMASLNAELNLNPTLVATQDDCNLNTFEGFGVVGSWNNPLNSTGTALGYSETGVLGAGTLVSTGQILFPTAVVSFAGYIRPQRTGGTAVVPAGSHFEFVFPSLPTTLAVCLTGGNPSNATQLTFGFSATTISGTPALPTGSGNPSDPAIRTLGPQTGATNGAYKLNNGAVLVAGGNLPTCTIPVRTTTPPPISCNGG